ncbi:MAG: PleD family two-component system response regulator [Leptolyngbyaceae bacterium]|nr:PleD family two-component system response regulator [Leptolyngbyaceae bacterium]
MSIPAESFLILVVEDDRVSRQMLCRALTQEGYQVVEACDGEECLSLYEQTQPHLVLLDAMMPKMNGFECCTELLKLPGTENLPVIMVTGLEDQSSVDWAFDVGATDYVTKPIHWPILRRRVRNLLEKAYYYNELEQANYKLHVQTITDSLTGLANRRYFDECLDREWKRSLREQKHVSLILFDIDYFKLYNDAYGHQDGDTCLKHIARALKQKAAKRATDIMARYGGEEFAAILPSTDLSGALEVATNLQEGIKALRIPHKKSKGMHKYVTISQGIASLIATPDLHPSDLLNFADQALYHAKRSGRNSIAIYRKGQVLTTVDLQLTH